MHLANTLACRRSGRAGLIRWTLGLMALALADCAPTAPPATPSTVAAAEVRAPLTILISIDAFRPDYLGRGDTPVMDALAQGGVKATMRPSFPSLTFPNHTALVTGQRPDRNGVVANNMFDPRRPGDKFYNKDPKSSDPFWWAESEPIWITAEKNHIRAGTMFWPGEEASHDGVRASDWARFDPDITADQRMRTVMDWMRRPAAIRPGLAVVYFDDVDRSGHKNGPWGTATIEAVRHVDTVIGGLVAELKELGQPANMVIVSDHGMRNVEPERTVRIDQILPAGSVTLVGYGPFASIEPVAGHEDEVAKVLLAPNPNMTCWRRQDVPARYHYGANPRVASFVCLSINGGEVVSAAPTNKGEHGYDIDDPEMTALFLVNGPAFRQGAAIPAKFDNVDLYPMLARLIGVPPQPNDGDPATLAPLLATP